MDKQRARIFSKDRCKKCYGKGYLIYQTGVSGKTIRKAEGVLQSQPYCDCVVQNVKKYAKDLNKAS